MNFLLLNFVLHMKNYVTHANKYKTFEAILKIEYLKVSMYTVPA